MYKNMVCLYLVCCKKNLTTIPDNDNSRIPKQPQHTL